MCEPSANRSNTSCSSKAFSLACNERTDEQSSGSRRHLKRKVHHELIRIFLIFDMATCRIIAACPSESVQVSTRAPGKSLIAHCLRCLLSCVCGPLIEAARVRAWTWKVLVSAKRPELRAQSSALLQAWTMVFAGAFAPSEDFDAPQTILSRTEPSVRAD